MQEFTLDLLSDKIYSMAIAFDASAFSSWTTGTSHTLSHTCTGSNGILFWSTLSLSSSDIVTWVTYNWVSMTRIDYIWWTWEWIYLYYLLNPATGANNIVATTSSSVTMYAESSSYTGVKQSWQPDSTWRSVYATQANMSTSTTTVADNSWIVWVFRSSAAQTAAAWTTLRAWVNTTIQIGDSNWAKTPPWSYSLWTTFSSAWCAQIVASFSPFVTASTTSPAFLLNFL